MWKRRIYLWLQDLQDSFMGGVMEQGIGIGKYLNAGFNRWVFWKLRRASYYFFSKKIQDDYDKMKTLIYLNYKLCVLPVKKNKKEEARKKTW